jgi:hypothetical protein
MHEDGATDHDPQSDHELTELATDLLFDVTHVQLTLLSGGPAATLGVIWLPSLIRKAQRFIEAMERAGGSAIPAATPPEIHDMEARIYTSAGAIPPPPED